MLQLLLLPLTIYQTARYITATVVASKSFIKKLHYIKYTVLTTQPVTNQQVMLELYSSLTSYQTVRYVTPSVVNTQPNSIPHALLELLYLPHN
jgi:hypothetical protein